jgi:hypothetical protein
VVTQLDYQRAAQAGDNAERRLAYPRIFRWV